MVVKCEDKVFIEHDISPEQYTVLMAIKYLDNPVTPTKLAKFLIRNQNSVSMIVDRMVKAGLVRRVNDQRDRRSVRLFITGSGKEALDRAAASSRELVQRIMGKLTDGDIGELILLLEKIKESSVEYLETEGADKEAAENEAKNIANFKKRNKRAEGSAAKREG